MRKIIMIFKSVVLAGFCCSSGTANAQQNPGYLGYTKSVDLTITPLFSNILAGGPSLKPSFGLGYEMSRKSDFSWRFGVQQVTNVVSQRNMDFYENKLMDPTKQFSDYSHIFANGSFKYQYRAFTLGAKFFKSEKGAVAPYGSYVGFDLSYGTASITEASEIKWSNGKAYENEPWKKVKIVSLQFNMGKRRYLSNSGISFFYQLGVGYPIWQNTPSYLSEASMVFNNHQDLLENNMVRHIANGSIAEFKVGLGYGIK